MTVLSHGERRYMQIQDGCCSGTARFGCRTGMLEIHEPHEAPGNGRMGYLAATGGIFLWAGAVDHGREESAATVGREGDLSGVCRGRTCSVEHGMEDDGGPPEGVPGLGRVGGSQGGWEQLCGIRNKSIIA
jgi:hypothetical protein